MPPESPTPPPPEPVVPKPPPPAAAPPTAALPPATTDAEVDTVTLVPNGIGGDGARIRTFAMARGVVLQGLLALGGLVAFLLLLLEFSSRTDPLLIAIAGAMLLWPLRQQKAVRGMLVAGGLLLIVWMFRMLGGVLAPFIVVYIVAYLLHPLVTLAQRKWNVPRWVSSLLVTFALLGVLSLVLFLLVPMVVGQVESLAQRIVGLALRLPDLVAGADFLDSAERAGLVDRATLVEQLREYLPRQVGTLVGRLPATLASLTRSVGALVGVLTTVVLVPVLLFYTLNDFGRIRDSLIRVMPRYHGSRAYLDRVGEVVGGYLRGQLTISLIAMIVVTIPLLIMGVPYALVIGLLTGLLNMVPTLGAILSYIIGGLLMLAFGTWGDVAIVLAVQVGQSLLEQTVLTPKIMGSQVGLHPVLVMLSLFVFSTLMGGLGLLVAVPLTALLVGLYRAFQKDLTFDLAHDPQPGKG